MNPRRSPNSHDIDRLCPGPFGGGLWFRGLARGQRYPAAANPRVSSSPVSVLKPLCGAEPRLYENLRSFCAQDYPEFQLVCGVQEGDDPAIAVVHRLAREFPGLSLELVIDPSRHGSNHKVSNLINILGRCRYEHLVLADSDIAVGADYLAQVVAPSPILPWGWSPACIEGDPRGIWSRLGALFIDDWFAPSVRVAHAFGSRDFAFGATLALRRATLIAVGDSRPSPTSSPTITGWAP